MAWIWSLLIFTVVVAIFIDSARLFFLGLLALAIKACPQVVLPGLGAALWWTIKINLKR